MMTDNFQNSENTSKPQQFQFVDDPFLLLPILKERLPQSCFIHNQVIKHKGFEGNKLRFYTVGGADELNTDTWIISQNIRQDYGSHFSISAPSNIISGTEKIPSEIFECFTSGGRLINWDGGLVFVALELPISRMIFEISATIKLNLTEAHPCYLYYMDPNEALNLNTDTSNTAVKKLSVENEDHDFLVNTWKYAKEGSKLAIGDCLQANVSGGVFLNGKCVSGVYTPGYGLLSSLYTEKEHRGKGYAKTAMSFAFKETAKEGCIPCCTVECKNQRSVDFHEKKLGAKTVSIVVWFDVVKLVVD